MNSLSRRAFLMSVGATLIPKIIRVVPVSPIFYGGNPGGGKSFLIMHPSQKRFYESLVKEDLWGIPYHVASNIAMKWSEINRSDYPMIKATPSKDENEWW